MDLKVVYDLIIVLFILDLLSIWWFTKIQADLYSLFKMINEERERVTKLWRVGREWDKGFQERLLEIENKIKDLYFVTGRENNE